MEQFDGRLLLIPGNVADDRQVVDILQAEDLLQLEGDHRQRVGVVAPACVMSPALPGRKEKPLKGPRNNQPTALLAYGGP